MMLSKILFGAIVALVSFSIGYCIVRWGLA
jgi:hypothetical protein